MLGRRRMDGRTDEVSTYDALSLSESNKPRRSIFTQCTDSLQQTYMIFLHNIHRLFFLMERGCVLCEVRTGSLYIVWIHFNLQKLCSPTPSLPQKCHPLFLCLSLLWHLTSLSLSLSRLQVSVSDSIQPLGLMLHNTV